MENLAPGIDILFLLITLAAAAFLYKIFNNSRQVVIIILSWLAIQGIVASLGFYTVTKGFPRFPLLLGIPLLAILSFFLFGQKDFLKTKDTVKWLTLLHTVRIPVELVLYFLFLHKAIPKLMTFEGSNPDILSGLSAPVIWWLYRRGTIGRNALLVWNIICLSLLLNIVIRALLSAPLPFQQFAFEQPNIAILHFPFIFLPGFIVPVVLFSHLVMLFQIPFRTSIPPDQKAMS